MVEVVSATARDRVHDSMYAVAMIIIIARSRSNAVQVAIYLPSVYRERRRERRLVLNKISFLPATETRLVYFRIITCRCLMQASDEMINPDESEHYIQFYLKIAPEISLQRCSVVMNTRCKMWFLLFNE